MGYTVGSDHIRESNLIEGVDLDSEVKQSMRAWVWLSHQQEITLPVILKLHKLIMWNQLTKQHLGRLRTSNVMVGNYVAPEPYIAHQQLHNWLLDMKDWHKYSAKNMHIRFERIHPFIDGNGRTGRMLMWWHEAMKGYEPTIVKFDDRKEYYDWFKETGYA